MPLKSYTRNSSFLIVPLPMAAFSLFLYVYLLHWTKEFAVIHCSKLCTKIQKYKITKNFLWCCVHKFKINTLLMLIFCLTWGKKSRQHQFTSRFVPSTQCNKVISDFYTKLHVYVKIMYRAWHFTWQCSWEWKKERG